MLYISDSQSPSRKTPSPLASPYFSPSRHVGDPTPNFGRHFSVGTGPGTNRERTAQVKPLQAQANPLGSLGPNLSDLLERLGKLKPLLIQERVADDPWKVLIAVTLLNKTAGKLAIPVFWKIIEKWPTPLDLAQANLDELISIIHKLGTQTVRSKRLIQLSNMYLKEPPSMYDFRRSRAFSSPQRKSRFFTSSSIAYPSTPISHLPGAGPYALDSYRIFCCVYDNPISEEWKLVRPTDKELIRYLRWKWGFQEHIEWSPNKGVVGQITPQYLTSLIDDLEANTTINLTKSI